MRNREIYYSQVWKRDQLKKHKLPLPDNIPTLDVVKTTIQDFPSLAEALNAVRKVI